MMYLSPVFTAALADWSVYGRMLVSFAAEDLGSDETLILDLDAGEQLAFLRRWDQAGGCVRRCPACWRVYGARHKLCECGAETHIDDWYSGNVTRMLAALAPWAAE